MRRLSALLLSGPVFATVPTIAAIAGNVVLTVGPTSTYHTVSAAVAAADKDTTASNYYTIEVTPGTYTNDFSTVTRPMTIESTTVGKQAVLNATASPPNQKGIILNVSNLTVNGLTFQGSQIPNTSGGNSAGIRDQ